MKKSFKTLLRDYFDFSKTEKSALIILIAVSILISIYPIIGFKNSNSVQTDFSLIKNLESMAKADSGKEIDLENDESFQEYPEHKKVSNKFLFNPNTATSEQLQLLGFKKYLSERIVKFRSAGGKFYFKSDINKIYGIDPVFAQELMPYIDLPEKKIYDNGEKDIKPVVQNKYSSQLIDINTADTFTLNKLNGIGNKLSQRIVSFREKLGGFFSLDQLNEVYGLKPEVIAEIKPRLKEELYPFKTIDINIATMEELSSHPYIKRNLAEIIINYRNQHGRYNSVSDLLQIKVIDEDVFNKLKNYLKVCKNNDLVK